MSTLEDFPGLVHADDQAQRAALLLETASHSLTHPHPDEDWATRAQRLRGAAILCTSAALEIMNSAGWNEAASEAAARGLLEEK